MKPYMKALAVSFLLGFGCVYLFAAGTQPDGVPGELRGETRLPSTYINARVLAANTAETITAPTFAGAPSVRLIAFFSATCTNWYYSATGTAAVPAADVTDGSAAGRAPAALKMDQGDTLSIVADATCTVTTEYLFERGGD